MVKLILSNFQSPGDIIMLTCAIRDLHNMYPGEYLTDVRTSCDTIFENNPYITMLDENDPDVITIPMHYPMIHKSNEGPYHFTMAFTEYLAEQLGRPIDYGKCKGDIYISDKEKSWFSQIREITGKDIPYWIIVAGGKEDCTIKWWEVERYQKVVDHFAGKITFVQVGAEDHHHPRLSGVLDLRGKTDFRQLIRLVYHSYGIVCPVTCLMHLAAAVPVRDDFPRKNRSCVVIAGGREPARWEAYTSHAYLHTCGMLPCCDNGGCWKSRIEPLEDGDQKDDDCCLFPVTAQFGNVLPKCMDMISAEDVIRYIELYDLKKEVELE